jgi:ABC-type Fe3+-hydroxamate transport system substrate-binding protein
VFGKAGTIAMWAAAAALLAGCASSASSASTTSAVRIVTLMPSFAQDVCAIGAGANLVGVSEYSESAGCAKNVPRIANFSSLNAERIVALHPSAVIAIPEQQLLAAPLRRAGLHVEYLSDDSYGDIFSNIERIGELTAHGTQAQRLVAQLRARTKRLQAGEHIRYRPRVFVVLQAQPVWTVGPQSYIAKLLDLAGARNAVTQLQRPYAEYSAEELLRLQPDAILCDRDAHLEPMLGREPWRSLRAVREGHVFILKDPAILETPGPRYNEGLSWLIEHLRSLSQ